MPRLGKKKRHSEGRVRERKEGKKNPAAASICHHGFLH
jgi:hypothetical protein